MVGSDATKVKFSKAGCCYNGWGGANFYGGNGPATGQGAGRAYAVSYNRPIATRGGVGTYAGPQDYRATAVGIFFNVRM